MELPVNLGEIHSREFGFHTGLGFEEDVVKDGFDFGPDGAFVVGREMPQTVIGLGLDCTIDVKERNLVRGARKRESPRGTFLSMHQTRLHQSGKQSSNDDRIGIDAGRDLSRRHRRTRSINEIGEDVYAHSESGITSHLLM